MGTGASGAGTYSITGQVPKIGLNDQGQYVDGYQIDFVTGLSNRGWVFVPRDKYNAANAAAMVKAHASELDAVSQSGS